MRRLLPLLLVSLLVSACTSASGAGSAGSLGSDSGFVGGDGSIVVVEPSQRVVAPNIQARTLDQESFDLADYRGQVVVLNVWASWCAPCRAEAPELEEVWRELRDQGVQFVGLNTRDSVVSARRFVESMGLTFPSVEDPDGRIQLLFSDSLPPQAIPSTVVIDKQGRVAGRILGKASTATLRGVIDEVSRRG